MAGGASAIDAGELGAIFGARFGDAPAESESARAIESASAPAERASIERAVATSAEATYTTYVHGLVDQRALTRTSR